MTLQAIPLHLLAYARPATHLRTVTHQSHPSAGRSSRAELLAVLASCRLCLPHVVALALALSAAGHSRAASAVRGI
jgi:hypothetical protein